MVSTTVSMKFIQTPIRGINPSICLMIPKNYVLYYSPGVNTNIYDYQ